MANLLTAGRIVCAVVLLFLPPFSASFYAFYLAAGLTDMLDGFVARRTHSTSDFGARLDTIADLVFAAICLIRLLPALDLPRWLYVWAALIAVIKAFNLLTGLRTQKHFPAVHSRMNRLTGLLLFLLPLTAGTPALIVCAAVCCAAASYAAVQENHILRTQDRP